MTSLNYSFLYVCVYVENLSFENTLCDTFVLVPHVLCLTQVLIQVKAKQKHTNYILAKITRENDKGVFVCVALSTCYYFDIICIFFLKMF